MSGLPEYIRAFVAVRIPETTRAQLADVQRQLKPELRDVSWTRPDAIGAAARCTGWTRSTYGAARIVMPKTARSMTRQGRTTH